MIEIIDGTGKGYRAAVDKRNQLRVRAESESIQHTQGLLGNTYQIKALTDISAGTIVALHVENSDSDNNMVITYIRHQIIDAIGGTVFPNQNNYMAIGLGQKYVSGGIAVIPVNLNTSSGELADIMAYTNNPTLSNSFSEIDRWYTKANGDMNVFSKEGSIIVTQNSGIQIKYIGDQTSGKIYTRISFIMKPKD